MTFIVETGAGLATSNSYVAVAYADTYHTTYGNTAWKTDGSIPDTTKQLALMLATQACDVLYGQRYMSLPQYSTQALLFPRFVMVVNRIQIIQAGTLPTQLLNAVCELALMQLIGTNLFPDPNTLSQIQSQTVKVGDIETSTAYGHTVAAPVFAGFQKVELLLQPILCSPGLGSNPTSFGY